MPIYEYVCQSCDHRFEHLARSMSDAASDEAKVLCPDCNSTRTRRALSVFAVGGEGSTGGNAETDPGMCGRCGGPGPCGGGDF